MGKFLGGDVLYLDRGWGDDGVAFFKNRQMTYVRLMTLLYVDESPSPNQKRIANKR